MNKNTVPLGSYIESFVLHNVENLKGFFQESSDEIQELGSHSWQY